MTYTKATVTIYDLGNEEILTCSGMEKPHDPCETSCVIPQVQIPFVFKPIWMIIPFKPVRPGRRIGRR